MRSTRFTALAVAALVAGPSWSGAAAPDKKPKEVVLEKEERLSK